MTSAGARPNLTLALAAAYDLAFAAWLALSPASLFGLVGEAPPWPDWMSRALAASIALVGVALAIGAWAPRWRRWAVVLGLLSKSVPPLAWLVAVLAGWMPAGTWVFILVDDVAWWWPFLRLARREP